MLTLTHWHWKNELATFQRCLVSRGSVFWGIFKEGFMAGIICSLVTILNW
uniref:Uncharacterized protein n=1 Tax=Anguilla anguilla TaxID=7936 RepID=A0A0E9UP40_ANGAN